MEEPKMLSETSAGCCDICIVACNAICGWCPPPIRFVVVDCVLGITHVI